MNMLCAHLNWENDISADFLIANHKDIATHCATQLPRIAETDPNAFNAKLFLRPFEGWEKISHCAPFDSITSVPDSCDQIANPLISLHLKDRFCFFFFLCSFEMSIFGGLL